MLYSEAFRRYYIADTIAFRKNVCVYKKVYYSFEDYRVRSKVPFMIDNKVYIFANDSLIGFEKRFHSANGVLQNKPISDYFDSKITIHNYGIYPRIKLNNMDDAKASFFKSYISHY